MDGGGDCRAPLLSETLWGVLMKRGNDGESVMESERVREGGREGGREGWGGGRGGGGRGGGGEGKKER